MVLRQDTNPRAGCQRTGGTSTKQAATTRCGPTQHLSPGTVPLTICGSFLTSATASRRHQSKIATTISQLTSHDVTRCACGIPNRANWHTHAVVGRPHESGFGTETDYCDIYTCDEHFPGYPDGSMSGAELRSMFRFDGADSWEVLEHRSTHLR